MNMSRKYCEIFCGYEIFSFHQNQHFSGYSIYDKYFRGWNKN